MAGDSRRREDLMAALRNLSREEILEVLSEGLCHHCEAVLETRIHNLITQRKLSEMSLSNDNGTKSSTELVSTISSAISSHSRLNSNARIPKNWGLRVVESTLADRQKESVTKSSSPPSVKSKQQLSSQSSYEILLNDGLSRSVVDNSLSEEEREFIRLDQVGRKKDFVCYEKINGKGSNVNVVKGLELHTRVFNPEEQKKIVDLVYTLQKMGQKGQLRERTYSEPRKWMRGKGRVTMQFGCCYNYAVDKDGNPPGIVRDEEVDPLPPLFKKMIRRMVRWHVLPPTCVPDSCIVNIYEEGDCIPPHIDHHDFLRPFCTVSFLAECNILFGTTLKIINPGEFAGPFSLPLPLGSVLILNGNGADVAKHCVPGVPSKRISITFRKMDDSKLPVRYSPDPELSSIKPLVRPSSVDSRIRQLQTDSKKAIHDESKFHAESGNKGRISNEDEFPPLGKLNSSNRRSHR